MSSPHSLIVALCIAFIPFASRPAFSQDEPGPSPQEKARMIEQAAAETAAEIRELRDSVRKQADLADVSVEAIRKTIGWLEEQRESLELDEVGSTARRAALVEAMDETAKKAEQSVKDDAVAVELKKVVENRERALERVEQLYKAASAPAADVDDAASKVSESRAALATRQREAVATAGGDLLATWNRELITLTIGEKERHARLQHIRKKLDQLRGVMNLVDQLQEKEAVLQSLRIAMEEQRRLLLLPPPAKTEPAPAKDSKAP